MAPHGTITAQASRFISSHFTLGHPLKRICRQFAATCSAFSACDPLSASLRLPPQPDNQLAYLRTAAIN
jgi:hypothetical protein